MKEGASQKEIHRVMEEVKKYGLKPVLIRLPGKDFSNKNFKEER